MPRMRKTTDNPVARDYARKVITDRASSAEDTAAVVALFPSVEFETTTTRVGGEEISMRRVVLTGGWEVVSNGV